MLDIPDVLAFVSSARAVLAKDYPFIAQPCADVLDQNTVKLEPFPVMLLPQKPMSTLAGFITNINARVNTVNAQRILCNVESACAVIRYLAFEVI